MTYKRFEDLPVWQAAARLYVETETLLDNDICRFRRGFVDQLDRAALSVSNNIAEGFERGTTAELLQFIYIARGSAGEVRSMLGVFERSPRGRTLPPDIRSGIVRLKELAENCGRQLRGWADTLQNSEVRGQRHLNRKAQQSAEAKQRAESCRKMLLSKLPATHPLVMDAKERGIL